ncbi:MAG: hypothetical protein IKI13_06720 [Bacteroidales bacterium]|nr:hypothetical protein [Bacteroidales bacterium]
MVSNPELLRKDTVKLVFETCVSPDTAHEWQTWRRSLYHFLQLIFK